MTRRRRVRRCTRAAPATPSSTPWQRSQPALFVTKSVNSAFYGDPDLQAWLAEQGIGELVICGIQTNMCVETTARMAGNLGYDVTVALDATRTFDLRADVAGLGIVTRTAAELMATTALVLQAGGFARIATTAELIGENRTSCTDKPPGCRKSEIAFISCD